MTAADTIRLGPSLERLTRLSQDHYYNPYEEFDWPSVLPGRELWMPADLMSVAGTELGERLSDEQRIRLSHSESINFYSLNVHGIRELLREVIARMYTPKFAPLSEYLHHFVKEENEHMWFFAEFCGRYGGGVYPDRKLRLESFGSVDVQDFLAFARIMMFEEIGHRFNARMAADDTLHPIIRQINRQHHQDEARHIAFGRKLVSWLFEEVSADHDTETITDVGTYCERFLVAMIKTLYDPRMYRDAGLDDGFGIRTQLLADRAREPYHDHLLGGTVSFLHRIGVLARPNVSIT